jgi:hypothetical protein
MWVEVIEDSSRSCPYVAGRLIEVSNHPTRSDSYEVKHPTSYAWSIIKKRRVRMLDFKPESGMTFETEDGRYGVFIQAGNRLAMLFKNKDGGDTYNSVPTLNGIARVYKGAIEKTHILTCPDKAYETTLVWEKLDNKVKLNSEYTAEIIGEEVKVGCQTFPLSRVKEIVRVAESLTKKR